MWDLAPYPRDLGGGLPTCASTSRQTDLGIGYRSSKQANLLQTFSAVVGGNLEHDDLGRHPLIKKTLSKSRLPERRLQHTIGAKENTIWTHQRGIISVFPSPKVIQWRAELSSSDLS